MADQTLIPITAHDRNTANALVGMSVPLLVLCSVVAGARLTPKLRPAWHFGWDDGFIIIAWLLVVAEWAITIAAMYWCVGNPPDHITAWLSMETTKIGYFAIPVWACAAASVKLSIIFMLLRFRTSLPWKVFLYFMVAVQVVFAIGNTVFLLAIQCRPLAADWDYSLFASGKAKCLGPHSIRLASNISSYTSIATDVILSIIPLTFLRKLNHRSIMERALVFVLMALGLSASAASIRKMLYIRHWGLTEDQLGLEFSIEIYSCLELFLGLLAACLPCFKASLQRVLAAVGITFRQGQASLGSWRVPDRSGTSRVKKSEKGGGRPGKVVVVEVDEVRGDERRDDRGLISNVSATDTVTTMSSFSYPGRLDSESEPGGKVPLEKVSMDMV